MRYCIEKDMNGTDEVVRGGWGHTWLCPELQLVSEWVILTSHNRQHLTHNGQ